MNPEAENARISPRLNSVLRYALRDPIPVQEFGNFASVDGRQSIEPVDTGDDISGFELVKSAGG